MAMKFLNRVRMSVSGNPGTGTVVLHTPATGFQSFDNAGLVDGDTTPYLIEDGTPVGSIWELGVGTWHSNQTFTRDTVTQSSAGGTSYATFTSTAIISAIFRASDLTGIDNLASLNDVSIIGPTEGQLLTYNAATSKWENRVKPGQSQPQVVQYGIYQGTTNPPNITLGAAPTVGNYLIGIGNGGGGSTLGVYYAGFNPSWPDKAGSFEQKTQYDCSYVIRSVHVGDGATWTMGQIGASGPTLNAVLVEVSGVDISRVSEFLMNRGSAFGTSNVALNTVGPVNGLTLMFGGGDPNTIGVVSPTPPQVLSNNVNGSSLVFDYDNNTGGYNGLIATMSSGTLGALVMTLPGV